ncbi:hypothetical protein EIN_154390 [Entamoeba invadens IP1]|uniref:Kinetochore protein NDC80 n=1 Tax=Entamoeba invadens IP1 TaxID=370355 RepID=A0A0A1U975_ENTIV|nr:hypothetical protein EIN_154390 [Entamoeba invadens IP1]ELP91372.1 hypothetical protein EIN_154390 [Entamoeba invadens IP1]|eukprot:XP_004258143.1 hypothetical protein EIN_154390 [Entamoeba invadens IP1]
MLNPTKQHGDVVMSDQYFQMPDFIGQQPPTHSDNKPWHFDTEFRQTNWVNLIQFLETLRFDEYCAERSKQENYKTNIRTLSVIKEQLPTNKEYALMAEMLARRVLPNYKVKESRLEESLTKMFSILGIAFNSKYLMHTSAPHCWSFMLSGLVYLKELGDSIETNEDGMFESTPDEQIENELNSCVISSVVLHKDNLQKSQKLEEMISGKKKEIEKRDVEVNKQLEMVSLKLSQLQHVEGQVDYLKEQKKMLDQSLKEVSGELTLIQVNCQEKKEELGKRGLELKTQQTTLKDKTEQCEKLRLTIGETARLETVEEELYRRTEDWKEAVKKTTELSLQLKETKEALSQEIKEVKNLVNGLEKELSPELRKRLILFDCEDPNTCSDGLKKYQEIGKIIKEEFEEKENAQMKLIDELDKQLQEVETKTKAVQRDIEKNTNEWNEYIKRKEKADNDILRTNASVGALDRAGLQAKVSELNKKDMFFKELMTSELEWRTKAEKCSQRLEFFKQFTHEKNIEIMAKFEQFLNEYQKQLTDFDLLMQNAKRITRDSFEQIGVHLSTYLPKTN